MKKQRRRHGNSLPISDRLGWRVLEFAKLIGISKTQVWQQIKDGEIQVIDSGGIKIVPRAYAIKAGYITQ